LDLLLSAATSALDGFTGAFGIGIATAAATAIGITAVPTPITEQEWDGWIFWHAFSVRAPAAFDGTMAAIFRSVEIDSKAMRKLREEDSIYAAVEVIEQGTSALNVGLDTRILLKLS
jgi:hypothetical protein